MVILAATVVVVVAVAVQVHQVLGQQGLGPATEAMVFPLQLQAKTYIGLVAGVVGVFVAVPVIACSSTAAYRQLFGSRDRTGLLGVGIARRRRR